MAIYEDSFEKCRFLNKSYVSDGEGGYETTWTEGAEFNAAFPMPDTEERKIAAMLGQAVSYNVFVGREVTVDYHDVFRRVADGQVFRVTADGHDNQTPRSAGLNLRMFTAEKWELPS